MKATIDIPDELYRKVKAKSALEGRPLRHVAIGLFQNWLGQSENSGSVEAPPSQEELESCPWLTITRPFMKKDASHELSEIRQSIEKGWSSDA